MAQNQAVKMIQLKDILFSEEGILDNVESRDHIFEIKNEEGIAIGYSSLYDLKSYLLENEAEIAHFQIRNIDSEEWTQLFEHPYFQRRKPQLVAASTLSEEDDQEFYILKNGQKAGPYEKYELTSMLEEKEILLTDMVSTNGGHTWMKLYQAENFDRRVLKETDQLPGVPRRVISEANNESVIPIKPETEAISSLAYLSNLKRGKSVEREKFEVYQNDTVSKTSGHSIYKVLLVASLLGIGYFLFHIKNQLNSPFQPQKSPVGEQAQMLTPIEMNDSMPSGNQGRGPSALGERKQYNQINDQSRTSGKFESRSLDPIRPNQRKSFMETPKYQETRQNADANSDDPNYFYDNSSAMELDPVRSQVSKENYDNSAAEAEGPIPSTDNLFESEVSN